MSVSLCCRRFPHTIKSRIFQPKRNGYIVLLPEVNPITPENLQLMKDGMPEFSKLSTEICVTTTGKHLLDLEQGIRVVEQQIEKAGCNDVVKEIIEPIEKINSPLEASWGVLKNMYLTNSKLIPETSYIRLHHRARRARSAKFYSKAIYNACKECDKSKMSEEDQRVVDKYLLEGRLAGLELTEDEREELANTYISMSEARTLFLVRIAESSKIYEEIIHDPAITREMPDQLLRLLAVNKDEPSRGPWKIELKPFVTEMCLAYCPDRNIRLRLWEARTRVASQSLDSSELRNSATLEKIRALRRDEARLLGYKTYADLTIETKMAGSLENVQQTLAAMLNIAKPAADRELADLQKFAWDRGFDGELRIHDIAFWQRKQCRTLYNFQEEALTNYFPFEKVWSGLLALCERLFDIKIVEKENVDRWHPDVKFFQIFEDSNKPVAGFFLDPYTRPHKLMSPSRNAWCVNIIPAAQILKALPLSTLILHLDPPIYGKPALLTWSDVETLFKQFGHMLQQVLTNVTYTEVAGHSNIEWDAVEIVSNVFMHWLRDPSVLESISGHYASGEKLPVLPMAEIDKHFAGYRLCDELFKAHLDLELYTCKDYWQDVMKRLWPAHFNLHHDLWDSTPCSFTEIVTEQWCAAYYSHIWARMVAADVYSAFTEPDVDEKSIGTRFRDTYLAFGGSCHPGEVFRRFRGRDPSSEAYFKYLGLH